MSKMYFLPFRPAFDSAGITVPGSQHWFTLAGTNTPSAPFTDATLVTPLQNPLVANGIGYLPPVYLNPALSYRVRIYDENAVVGVSTPLEEYDPYVPALANADIASDLAAGNLPLSASSIFTVDMGTSSTPAAWLKTSLNSAWPGLLLENTIHGASSQVQLFWKRWDATGNPLVWQAAIDVDNNGGFKGLFNIEPIDITGPGVIATPIAMARTGEVGFGGIPVSGIQGAFRGKVRSFNVGGATIGRYEFGDGTTYLYGDSATPVIGVYLSGAAKANFTATGFLPQTTAAYDLGTGSLRFNAVYGVTADFSGAVNTAATFKVAGTQVVGARVTGWTASTGTPSRGAFAAAAAGTASAGYVQAEAQGALNRIAAIEARLIALEADARTHGLIA